MESETIASPAIPGLRERKKQQTRERLTTAALALFRERGYDGATVELIAERADVSVTTFFRYFESKEDVFLESHRIVIDRVERAIRERPTGVSVLTALRGIVDEVLRGELDTTKDEQAAHKRIDAVPELRDRIREYEDRIRGVLTEEYATQLEVPPSDLRPRLLAGVILSAFDTARTAWIEDRRNVPLRRYIGEMLDLVERMTAPVLAD